MYRKTTLCFKCFESFALFEEFVSTDPLGEIGPVCHAAIWYSCDSWGL